MTTNKKIILLILALSALTHFVFFGHPNQTVFDEVHFGKFISGYFTGEYFFDIHPPLGKLLISGVGYLSGFEPGFSFANIGETFPDRHYLWLRLLPALAGLLLPLIIFLLAKELGFSKKASLLAGLLIIFENALTVQSRFILLDSFLLLFGFSTLLFYFKYRKIEAGPQLEWRWLVLTGLSVGLAASVKWTGLSFLGIILILEFIRFIKTHRFSIALKDFSGLILIPLVVYAAVFAVHLSLLSKSGPGDAFMTPEFQKLNFVQKFKELNQQMYSANQRLTATHPYGSQWYSWPLLTRPIFYWVDSTGSPQVSGQEKIYLLGNPFIWWAGTIAIIFLLVGSVKKFILRKTTWRRGTLFATCLPAGRARETKSSSPKPWNSSGFLENFLLLGFFINLLPFIGISRVMFLYHYFPSLIFSILAIAYLAHQANKKSVLAFFTIISIAGFLYFSPLTYGLPISPQLEHLLFWFPSWR